MYLLCREYRFSNSASFASGLIFTFSGYALSILSMPTTFSSVIWLPLIFLFFRRSLSANQYYSVVTNTGLTGLFLTLMFLGGEPTVLYATGWLLLGYLLFSRFGEWNEIAKGMFTLFFAVLLMALLSAVQLLPFMELLFHTSRAGGISFAEASHFCLEPRKLIGFIFPHFFQVTRFPWVGPEWLKFPYFGFIPAILALFSFFLHKDKRIWWFALLTVLILLIAFGSYSPIPIYFWLYKFVPGFSLFRYPAKFIFILFFVFSLLSGLGIDLLWKNLPRIKKTLSGMHFVAVSFIFLFLWMVFNRPKVYAILKPVFYKEIELGWQAYLQNLVIPRNIANFGILSLFLLLFALWLSAGYFRKVKKEIFGIGLALLVFLDLYTANAGVNLSIRSEDYKVEPKNVKIIKKDQGIFRFFAAPEIYKRSHYEISHEYQDYSAALVSIRNRLTSNQHMLFHFSDIDGYESVRGADQEKLLGRIYALDTLQGISILDMLNVKYLVTPWRFKQKGFELVNWEKEKFREGAIFLYQNKNALPRAFLVPKAKFMEDREKILDYIFSQEFDPEGEVVLEKKIEGRGTREGREGKGSAKIIKYKPNKVEIEVFSSRPGYLFLSDWFYPGWKAYLDKSKVEIYRANYMFRAVHVPAGKHLVEFVYDPFSFKLGALISSITLLGLLGAFGFLWRKQLTLRRNIERLEQSEGSDD